MKTAFSEQRIIFLLCLLAAVHVFIFAATFPFFDNVDEQAHIDLAVRYSQGNIPRTLDWYSAEARPYLVAYDSLAYLWPPAMWPRDKLLDYPAWKQPMDKVRPQLLVTEEFFKEKVRNHEDSQPPLYYALAGAWWRIGQLLKFDGLALLYWLRFFNVLLTAVLVWVSWMTAWSLFPDNPFIRIAVPAIIAFMPQTIFYSVNNDILSPLTFGVAFLLLLKWREAPLPSPRLAAACGLALAATFLTKMSNLPLLIVAGFFLAFHIFSLARQKKLSAAAPALSLLAACFALPAAAWMMWCKLNFGDLTGSTPKVRYIGWTTKPFAGWFQHPIFSPHGLWIFLSGNVSTFWQGEFEWHGQPLAISDLNLFYVLLTFAGLLSALVALLRTAAPLSPAGRQALWFGFACGASVFTFLALLSVKYDFQDCRNPSREHPYFVSGRIMLGMLVPFMVLFAYGIDQALKKMSHTSKFILLTAFLLFMLVSEITVDLPIFPDDGNFFHM